MWILIYAAEPDPANLTKGHPQKTMALYVSKVPLVPTLLDSSGHDGNAAPTT